MSHETIIINRVVVDIGHDDLKITRKDKRCSRLNALQVLRVVWKYLRSP